MDFLNTIIQAIDAKPNERRGATSWEANGGLFSLH